MKAFIIIGLLLTFGMSCKPAHKNLEDYEGKQLIIANGGGFTGQVIEYNLLENGYIYRHNSLTKANTFHKRIDKKEVDQIFDNYSVLKIGQLDLNEPGNMYFYISLVEKDRSHEVKWNSDSTSEESKIAKLFYQTVLQRIK